MENPERPLRRTFVLEICEDELLLIARACETGSLSPSLDEKKRRWLLRARDLLRAAPNVESGPSSHSSIWRGNSITFVTFLNLQDM